MSDLSPEGLFRKHFCSDCIYWNGEPHYSGKKADYSKEEWAEVMEEVDPASCGLPGNKDCPLQDWETYAKDALEYAQALGWRKPRK